jgi:hypothetical protein
MELKNYLGFKLSDIKPILDINNIEYEVKEVWDTKNTKIGNDLRIINFVNSNKLIIYVAYF